MSDRIIDATDAPAINVKARRDNPLVGWVVSKEDPDHPGKMVARLVTGTSAPFTLVADTLAELRAQLPRGLEHSKRGGRLVRYSVSPLLSGFPAGWLRNVLLLGCRAGRA
jgi:hypothetical protein